MSSTTLDLSFFNSSSTMNIFYHSERLFISRNFSAILNSESSSLVSKSSHISSRFAYHVTVESFYLHSPSSKTSTVSFIGHCSEIASLFVLLIFTILTISNYQSQRKAINDYCNKEFLLCR